MKEKVKNVVFSTFNVLLVAAVLLFMLWGLAKIGLIDLPAFFLFGKDPNAPSNWTDNGLSDILKDSEPDDGFTVLKAEMTPESVRTMLAALTPRESYAGIYRLFRRYRLLPACGAVHESRRTACVLCIVGRRRL